MRDSYWFMSIIKIKVSSSSRVRFFLLHFRPLLFITSIFFSSFNVEICFVFFWQMKNLFSLSKLQFSIFLAFSAGTYELPFVLRPSFHWTETSKYKVGNRGDWWVCVGWFLVKWKTNKASANFDEMLRQILVKHQNEVRKKMQILAKELKTFKKKYFSVF